MRIGIVGLGDIAQKAYLPVLSQKEGIELVLCTRNKETLDRLADKYRIMEKVESVDGLMAKQVDAVFISAATEAHAEIVEELLEHGIHVYIDKPISLNFKETQRIVELARETGRIAIVGFNRRFISAVNELKGHGKPNLLIMQKNRFDAADEPRRFVVEDFVHVVDTLRFLMDTEVKEIKVDFLLDGELLDQLVVQLIGEGCQALGIMNRNGGVTEEIIEYTAGHHKYVVDNLTETTHYHNKDENLSTYGGWEPTLSKRGFYQIVDHFLDCVKHDKIPDPSIEDSLTTHEICEEIVQQIDRHA
ncbi:Gfo/Idh/MocA family protein [Halobacillus sp. Marseille-Q1614]|uniref:Gfo/Idh/MocA family protein n=1 Tax=Halobacillus sp. Marseille-Q1614 TaxID=2709134 RepID=UPI00156FFA51|nr:Gfo/Idh/MocA family oxidoreductase [Halobacillus sp. Marseille-Q1614]